MKIFGVTGWKNSGKTGLMERLVTELTSRGVRVSTVKHAHHDFDLDQPGKDSFRHRHAGAEQVVLASAKRWAVLSELRGQDEPSLADLLSHMNDVDLVLVEGFKRDDHPKIECFRSETGHSLIAKDDDTIVAMASDVEISDLDIPFFDLNDTQGLTDFVLQQTGQPK